MFHLDHLPDQRENEKVVLFLRRHWISVLVIVVAFLFLTGVPLFIGWFFSDVMETWLASPTLGPIVVVAASIYFLSIWLFAFLEFTDYYLDTWIVTNQRIINIEQEGLFNRIASELDLAAVQDTTAEIRGILQTMLTYGQVYVQTAGEKGRFHFKNIDNPEQVKETIAHLVEEDKQRIASGGIVPGRVKSILK
ncbi:PH domain-containing protein [Candidatus Uhrbacteria bacterium]|nr:PH domain-containing protein [Candidatus Uhrbacteria bacterium]